MSSIKFRLRGSFLAVLAVGLVWIGCTDNRTDLTSPADLGPNILVVDQVALSHAIRVQKAHTDEMFEIAGVVGTAVGLSESGRPVVKIFTREAGVDGLPESLEGVPVAVEVTGMIFALRALADPTLRFERPVPIGVSTGHPDITAGTIGARVTDGTDVFALSNNHVYADQNEASIGDDVIQPGTFDGGALPDDFIGSLYDFEPIKFAKRRSAPPNTMDAAIVLSSTVMLGNATPGDGYGMPSSTIVGSVSVGQAVKKYGRTTKLTSGEVSAISVTVDVCYGGFVVCTKWARFEDQIAITDGTFSGGGDSGSLIVTQNGNNPVGLLFAGSSTHTIANRIDLVLSRFGVTIDDGVAAPNNPPSANAGPDQSVNTGSTVQLDGSGSSDPDDDPITYSWAFVSNPSSTTLSGANTATPTFVADVDGAYEVELTVSDGELSSTDRVVVTAAANRAPIANAGPDQSVNTGSTVQLDGSGSSDPDDDPITYSWAFVSNPSSTTLSGANTATPTFVADVDGAYEVELTVSDGELSSTDRVVVTAATTTETLTITKATYSSRKAELKVEATSSLGGETILEATFFVGGAGIGTKTMVYNAKKDKWSFTFDSGDGVSTTKPDRVRVCSTTTTTCIETTDIGGK